MAKYTVWISFSGWYAYNVEADSEEEARDIALEEADVEDCDSWDYNVEDIEEDDN